MIPSNLITRRVAIGGTLAAVFAQAGPTQALQATSNDQLSFVVYLPVKPSARDRMRRMMFEIIDTMSHESDFISTWVHEDLDDPDTIVNYETWACSRDDFLRRHLVKSYRQAFEAALPDLLSGDRRIVFLRPLLAYPRRTT